MSTKVVASVLVLVRCHVDRALPERGYYKVCPSHLSTRPRHTTFGHAPRRTQRLCHISKCRCRLSCCRFMGGPAAKGQAKGTTGHQRSHARHGQRLGVGGGLRRHGRRAAGAQRVMPLRKSWPLARLPMGC